MTMTMAFFSRRHLLGTLAELDQWFGARPARPISAPRVQPA